MSFFSSPVAGVPLPFVHLLLVLLLVFHLRGELFSSSSSSFSSYSSSSSSSTTISTTSTSTTTLHVPRRRSLSLFVEGIATDPLADHGPVELEERNRSITLRNGLVNITIQLPFGFITSIQYAGIDNILFTDQTIPWGGVGVNNSTNGSSSSTSSSYSNGDGGAPPPSDLGDSTADGLDDSFQPGDLFDSVHDSLPCYDGDYCYDPTVSSTYYAAENASSQAELTRNHGEPSKRAAWDMTWAREKIDDRGLYDIQQNRFQRLFGTNYSVIYPPPSVSSYSDFSIYSSDHNSSSSSSFSNTTNSTNAGSGSRFLRSADRIEISFLSTFNASIYGNGSAVNASQETRRRARDAPINFDIRYVMESGKAGIYTYLILDHTSDQDHLLLVELRMVVRLRPDLFRYAAIDENRFRVMPSSLDMQDERSRILWIVETRLLTNPINPALLNEVDHKYHYSMDSKDTSVIGWVSKGGQAGGAGGGGGGGNGKSNDIGVWWVTPHRTEWMGGGPMKQDLTVHTGPSMLLMLHSLHYGTRPISIEKGEGWKKVYGPCLLYFNQGGAGGGVGREDSSSADELWNEAVAQAVVENATWPYTWVSEGDAYPSPSGRGSVMGRLVVMDPYEPSLSGSGAWIGVIDSGSAQAGDFQNEYKG
ncbi:hypothetical protein CBR_g4769 [Chara braunii]|uniref:Uncharacterized protein n=1 Tax=Chara braunii TaxID=69332 RepID=A0A388KJ00_CHABU|nr:hypothetical protein CBR_g4769 [Chara braunii]|eukprot:GBG69943.1 hypothetical protein CBR_g4769 [Chara braunii]